MTIMPAIRRQQRVLSLLPTESPNAPTIIPLILALQCLQPALGDLQIMIKMVKVTIDTSFSILLKVLERRRQ
jgi:hypothetical protein